MSKNTKILAVALGIVGVAMSGWAVPIHFALYPTGNLNPDVGSQFTMEVTDAGNNQALFLLSNNGPIASTITDVLFYDGVLLGIAALQDRDDPINGVYGSAGVDFTKGAPFRPDRLPMYPAANFGTDRDRRGGIANGVDTGEWLGILFDLKDGATFDDLLDDLRGGDVFIGLHVQRIGDKRGSDWYKSVIPPSPSPVPVPDGGLTATLLGLALLGLSMVGRRLVGA